MLIEENKNQEICLNCGSKLKEEKKNQEICPNCGSKLKCSDYIYRRASSISGFQCSKCDYFEFYDEK